MRKTLLSLFILCFVFVSNAQQTLPAFNYTPQAPTTAAFTRYGDIPVDLSTGVTNISIPIFTLNENGINIPISISYHASGIKVDDVASSVGLGWTLNAGGIITRTVLGIKDEYLDWAAPNGNSLYNRPPFRNTSQFLEYNWTREHQPLPNDYFVWADELFNQIINVSPGNGQFYDFHSDRFYYNLGNGESGVFRKDFMGDDFKTIPYKPFKIHFIPHYGPAYYEPKLEMTTGDGVRYLFKKNSYDIWHPEKIFNNTNTDSVVYYTHADTITTLVNSSYEEFGPYKNTISTRTDAYIYSGGDSINNTTCKLAWRENNAPVMFKHSEFKYDEIVLVDSIVGSNVVIRFTYAKDREDVRINAIQVLSRLTGIQVFNKLNGALVKNINFSQTYTGDVSLTDRRMMLAGIQTGVNREEKYEFKYNPETLPPYDMRAYQGSSNRVFLQDFWGYYRGGNVSASLMFDDFSPEGAPDLFPNEDRVKAAILQEIKYPTGGKTVFEYESNRVPSYFYGPGFSSPNKPSDGKVGGLRIKKISSYAYDGAIPQVKTYEYECNLVKDYGYLDYDKFTYYQETWNYFDQQSIPNCGGSTLRYVLTAGNVGLENPMGRYIGGSQAPVYYNKVTEFNGDGNTNAGKTVYSYHLPDDILSDYIGSDQFRYCGPWDKDLGSYTPQLIKKEEYKNENGQYSMVRMTETEYTQIRNETFSTGFNLSSDLKFNPLTSDAQHAFNYYSRFANGYYFTTLHYSDPVAYRGLTLPMKTSVYDYVDNNNYVKNSTEYSYNQFGQQIAVTTTTSKGEQLSSKFTYPVDYSTQAPYNTMVERNILYPVVEQSAYKSINGTQNFLQSMKTNYNYWNYASQTWDSSVTNQILPKTVETKKGTNDAETRIQYYSYDQKSNPVYVAKENDTRQFYVWDYNKAYPVAQVMNVSAADKNYVVYNSFEAVTSWSPGWGIIVDDNTAPTGKKCLSLFGINSLQYALNNNNTYILSYWYKAGSSINVTANSSILANPAAKNGWVFIKRKITGSSSVAISGNGYIDELRLYPEAAQMTTFSYEPLVGMTAQCDANDRIIYYTYDASGRLTLVKDDNGNILKKIDYHFQSPLDGSGPNLFPQWEQTGTTRCKPCDQNPVYWTNITQLEERDNNPNSETYGNIRWRDTGEVGGPGRCYMMGDWKLTGQVRCRQLGGQLTGEQEREWKDMNPCSFTAGNSNWEIFATNTTACPVPVVFQSLDVSGVYYKENCGAQQIPKPYHVTMPLGAFTSSIDIQDATNKAKAEAQRLANVNGECATVYVKMVKVPNSMSTELEQYSDYTFYFFADAAGTTPLPLPSQLTVNFKNRIWWTLNGNFYYEEEVYNSTLYTMPGDTSYIWTEFQSVNCPNSETCRHQELTLLPGRYVIIP